MSRLHELKRSLKATEVEYGEAMMQTKEILLLENEIRERLVAIRNELALSFYQCCMCMEYFSIPLRVATNADVENAKHRNSELKRRSVSMNDDSIGLLERYTEPVRGMYYCGCK